MMITEKHPELSPATKQLKTIMIGLYKGLEKHKAKIENSKKKRTAKNYLPNQRATYVSDEIAETIEATDSSLSVVIQNSANHEFVVIKIEENNVNVIVMHLREGEDLPTKSRFRGNYSAYHNDRLKIHSIKSEPIGQLEAILQTFNDTIAPIVLDHTTLPFTWIVTYDGRKYTDSTIKIGALAPDQENWIFRDDITGFFRSCVNDVPAELLPEEESTFGSDTNVVYISSIEKNIQETEIPLEFKPNVVSPIKKENDLDGDSI
ncbi:hypothetical protein BC351_10355 [Paenibacillus ferrarius]|uniref:Uncharacterized protein n=1 Tax=Paenibacillus ferrarius TaxID=1469647 RepID=A0A1V4H8Q2_9BACL|nr:hypothetical protein [Paenibacillus ferrarius]OPH47584.1 hypothetical protein BC351_10355 [Paenibacillus ferrarius]